MLTTTDVQQTLGNTLYGEGGDKIGKIGQLFVDDQSGEPEFVTVNTGLLGTSESFVPIAEASVTGSDLTVPFGKSKVKDAPNVGTEGHLSEQDEQELYEYYDMSYGTSDDDTVGHDTSGPTSDDAMTRSEEKLDVGTERHETGRARLRKYVVTENVTTTVPVKKEKAVLETEPITDADRGDATGGPAISEEEHEVVLSEERPVVGKHAEPVERVRLGKQTETDEEQVSEDVRKEHIEAEGDVEDR